MALESVKIPQNVYIADRIIGPLTLRQIIMIALGCGFSYAMYSMTAKANGGQMSIVATILVWIPGFLSVVFALMRVNDLSLFRVVLLAIERFHKPATRTYAPRRGLAIYIRTGGAQEIKKAEEDQRKKKESIKEAAHTGNRIHELSTMLDRPITTLKDDLSPLPPTDDASPSFPVDPRRVRADPLAHTSAKGAQIRDLAHAPGTETTPADPEPEVPGGLSAYRGVFRDLSSPDA